MVEQHRKFKGLIEVKDNGITHWHPRQYITYRELAHALLSVFQSSFYKETFQHTPQNPSALVRKLTLLPDT